MAAAARHDNSNSALEKVKKQLRALKLQCKHFDELEKKLGIFSRDVDQAQEAVNNLLLLGTLLPADQLVAESHMWAINDARDAFRDFVQGSRSKGRHDDDHVLRRITVGNFLRDKIDDAIKYFNKF